MTKTVRTQELSELAVGFTIVIGCQLAGNTTLCSITPLGH